MRFRILIALFALLAVVGGCAPAYPRQDVVDSEISGRYIRLVRMHDDEYNVTCWIVNPGSYGSGLSCWPDHLLESR